MLFLFQGMVIAEGPMEEFVRRFGGGDIIVLEYEGDLSVEVLGALGRVGKVRGTAPLALVVEDARTALPVVWSVLSPAEIRVRSVNIRTPSLHDAFLSLLQGGGNGSRQSADGPGT